MKTEIYELILRHLTKTYNIDINRALNDIPPINLTDRIHKTTTELLVRDQVFYVTDNIIYKPLSSLDDNILIAKEIGYLKANTITINKI